VNTLLRLRKILSGLQDTLGRRALRYGVGASIEHARAFAALRFDTVIDVGANRGQFAIFARRQFPTCRIVSFEPLARPAATFEAIFRGDPHTRLVRAALGAQRGTATMRVTRADDSSSLLEVGRLQTAAFGTEVADMQDVPCGILGDFVDDHEWGERNLLKIDTQGSELDVLRGAEPVLGRFSAIYGELSFAELYVGQALASEVIAYLHARDFNLAGIFNLVESPALGSLQADMLFLRR
jgi:FkbM family methyltransferase